MKGIVDEGEEVAVIYIDGKPSAKYAKKHEAERDAEFMRSRHPNKKIEIKHEVRETEAKKGADGKRCWKGKRYAGTENGKDKCIPVKEESETKWEVAIEYGPTANHTAKIKVSAPDEDTAQTKALALFKKKYPDRRGMVGDCTQIKEAANPAQQAAIAIAKKKKAKTNEGVIVGHDANDPDVAILGGAGTYKLSNVKKKAQMEANELAKDIMAGKFKNSAYNVKQLANTLNTIVAAEEEMEKLYFGEDYTGEFAAEVTPAINPYGGLKDKKVRGAIGEALLSETPTDNPTGASGEGGWRTVKLKSAGTNVEEDTAYAGGMGQGGNAGQSYRKFKPKSAGTYKESAIMKGLKR